MIIISIIVTKNGIVETIDSFDISNKETSNNVIDFTKEDDFGIDRLWFVRRSRDYFEIYNEGGMKGYRIFNSCGSSVIAVK